jgi:hypothetical protein
MSFTKLTLDEVDEIIVASNAVCDGIDVMCDILKFCAHVQRKSKPEDVPALLLFNSHGIYKSLLEIMANLEMEYSDEQQWLIDRASELLGPACAKIAAR